MAEKGVKRSISETEDELSGIKVIILDIEGTTTPITFVTDILFGYVKKNLKSYLETHIDEEECKDDIQALRKQVEEDKKAGVDNVPEIPHSGEDSDTTVQAAVDNITWQMKSDRKSTALKQLQGHIWRHAYSSGEIKGRVYQDVVDFLKSWTSQKGKKAYIYSSGSVEAQKLLFRNSEHGDLTQYLSGHFDTLVGHKREKNSYTKILQEINCNSTETLFLTDIPAEAQAAIEAGMKTYIVTREGNAELTEEDKKIYHTISNFNEINTEPTQSKK